MERAERAERAVPACVQLVILGLMPALAAASEPLWPQLPQLQPFPTLFTLSALSQLGEQLQRVRDYLRRDPPVPEPPPSMTELCKLQGRKCDLHVAHTRDGYMLTLMRMRGTKRDLNWSRPGSRKATPVLVLHGNFATSDSWIMLRNQSNLGVTLSDAGYDVWFGNFRGSTHSRSHERLQASDPAFWKWSFHELGLYDLPAMIDLVLKTAGARRLHCVAHSLSTASFLVLASSKPEYSGKVRSAHLLAPALYLREGLLRTLSGVRRNDPYGALVTFIMNWLHRIGMEEIAPRSALIHYLTDIFCADDAPTVSICYALYQAVLGKGDPTQKVSNLLPITGAYHPGGTSLRCLEHIRALNIHGKFRPLGNGINDPNPGPEYNISAISIPVGLYYSKTDGVISPKDVDNLARELPHLLLKYEVPSNEFDHCDFMWAKDVKQLVYDTILTNMKSIDMKQSTLDSIDGGPVK